MEKEYTFYESSKESVIEQFRNSFGGNLIDGRLKVNNPSIKLNLYHYDFVDGFSFYINDFTFHEDIQIQTKGNPEDPSLIMRFDYEGSLFGNIEENEPLPNSGMIVYANTNSFILENKKGQNHKWFTIRLSKKIIQKEFNALLPLFDLLEKENDSWLIYDLIPMEVFLYLKDIFELKEEATELHRRRIIISRGIECIAVFTERLMGRETLRNFNIHTSDVKQLLEIKDQILSNIQDIASIEELSETYGYSPSKFKRDFKKVFGKPVHKFYIEYKLEKAKQLLIDQHLTVTEVSRIVGYKSLAKFSFAFKQQFNISPKNVTKQQ